MNELVLTSPQIKTGTLQLSPIVLKEDYRKEWNVSCNDFVCLTRDGEIVSYNLLRVGGIGHSNIDTIKYFMVLKYNEAYYDDSVTLDPTKKKHLAGCWTIFDDKGNIKFETTEFKTPYIVSNSCIYTMDSNYYNIETGELYCNTTKRIESGNYLFLENNYDEDLTKRGVWKINKTTGEYEIL